MQVLIADRNARLLEAIARTFAQQFTIHTAATHAQCNLMLLRGAFDLVVISEKLADGLGLQLLGRIARDSPDTLRVFTARRSRLQLLKGKLGPFGLFRTLAYPIDPQELLSLLTLARAGLEIQPPQTPAASAPAPGEAAPPVVERISFSSSDVAFAIDVPKIIASTRRRRRPKSGSAPVPTTPRAAPPPSAPVARQPSSATSRGESAPARAAVSNPPAQPQALAPEARAVAPQARGAAGAAPARHASPPVSLQATAASFRAPPRSPPKTPTHQRRSPRHEDVQRSPMRTKVVLGATIAAAFVATTLTLNMLDGGVHVTRASTPTPEITRPAVYTPPPPPPMPMAPAFQPTPQVAHRVAPKPAPAQSDVDPTDPQMAGNTPVADPSTFGSEAYEPIYPN